VKVMRVAAALLCYIRAANRAVDAATTRHQEEAVMLFGSDAEHFPAAWRRGARRVVAAVAVTALLSSGYDDTVIESAAPGTHAASTDDLPAALTEVPPCGQPNGSVVAHSSNISLSETWAGAGVTHRVLTSISITGSAVVTIEPCAIVELGPGVWLTVRDNARLVSAGTGATSFVVFRRSDPNQPWGTLRGYTSSSFIDLRWTWLLGGGASGGATISAFGDGYGSPLKRVLRAIQVVIESSQGVGVLLDANAGFTKDSKVLQIKGSAGRPVHTTMMALGSLPTGNYKGNGTDEILIHGPSANVFANMTVKNLGVPVRIPFTSMYIGPMPPAIKPVKLTLKPGVVFKFPRVGGQPGALVTFGTNGNAPNNRVGILYAVGTARKRIVFTSGEATPAPGDWKGIWLNTANDSKLAYVDISYAGGVNGIQSNNCRPQDTEDQAALLVGSFSDQYIPPSSLITESRITHSAYYGINAMWLAGTFDAPDLTGTNIFENNASCRQTYNGLLPPGTCPVGGGCTAY
jgi:hypothetical protein